MSSASHGMLKLLNRSFTREHVPERAQSWVTPVCLKRGGPTVTRPLILRRPTPAPGLITQVSRSAVPHQAPQSRAVLHPVIGRTEVLVNCNRFMKSPTRKDIDMKFAHHPPRPSLRGAAIALLCSAIVSGCGTGAGGDLGALQAITTSCPAGQQLASVVSVDASGSARSDALDAVRKDIIADVARRTAVCGGH